jgi:hypothetical protein
VPIFEPIFERLNEQGGRYVVVGGVAVVLHGFPRLTVDLDLIVDLRREEASRTIAALTSLGLLPLAPVRAEEFADSERRRDWIATNGMRVFSMYDPGDPLRTVDLFVESPIDFDGLWSRARIIDLDGTAVRVASIADLIDLKRRANRAQDREDIARLEEIAKREPPEPGARTIRRRKEMPIDPWESSTWEGNRRWQAARALAATPLQRLRWLESALRLALAAGALRARPAHLRQDPPRRPSASG